MKKAFLAIFLALVMAVALAAPVFAGVTVYNGKIEEAVSPGKTYIYSIRLQLFSKCSFNPMSVIGYDVG
jgi:hypothetical protein